MRLAKASTRATVSVNAACYCANTTIDRKLIINDKTPAPAPAPAPAAGKDAACCQEVSALRKEEEEDTKKVEEEKHKIED
mmetsp:Transcript_18116/g.25396  ORF Transcript_18116/g.25396 Transcript_18116/m.25396 type:complete len:80 (+) Transcript_18116:677-916(+)